MEFNEILELMIDRDATDIFIRVNGKLRARIHSRVEVIKEDIFTSISYNIIR